MKRITIAFILFTFGTLYCGKTIIVNLENKISHEVFEQITENAKDKPIDSYPSKLLYAYFNGIIGSNTVSFVQKMQAYETVIKYQTYPSIQDILTKTREEHVQIMNRLDYLHRSK
jgi:translation initiation factor RLI1